MSFGQNFRDDPTANPRTAGLIGGTLIAVWITIMNLLYRKLAVYLNTLENHRTETANEDALIMKTFLFQFANSYAALFYIAFLKGLETVTLFGAFGHLNDATRLCGCILITIILTLIHQQQRSQRSLPPPQRRRGHLLDGGKRQYGLPPALSANACCFKCRHLFAPDFTPRTTLFFTSANKPPAAPRVGRCPRYQPRHDCATQKGCGGFPNAQRVSTTV